MFRHLRVHQIFGANTEVGKTVFATALCRASVAAGEVSHYLKPVGTGGLGDDSHIATFSPKTQVSCLYRFDEPVSPHLAAQRTQKRDKTYSPPSDDEFASSLGSSIRRSAQQCGTSRSSLIVETAGGVHSPTLSGSSQADAYRPLRLPTVLVASPHLGGISTTLASYESLLIRGYTVDALLCLEEDYYANHRYFADWAQEERLAFASIQPPPEALQAREADIQQMQDFYQKVTNPSVKGKETIPGIIRELQKRHEKRAQDLETAPQQARSTYWYPFVQHNHIQKDDDIMVIDSAHKDCFMVHDAAPTASSSLVSVYDGSASWWTQCLGHGNPDLALAAAHAAGRYGHVIFPMATHDPALQLTRTLLDTVGSGWAERVFFSDDGSTGMEVALKMALKWSSKQASEGSGSATSDKPLELSILGMKGSYHGDTIGVMDASEPSVYNKSVEWYRGRGFWLDVPTVHIRDGKVTLDVPIEWDSVAPEHAFANLAHAYDVQARLDGGDKLYQYYLDTIHRLVSEARKEHNLTFGALVIEPLVIGAGGMLFVDPLFQRALVDFAREKLPERLPVVYDEVFVGLYRLGLQSSSTCLGVKPDVACYAKILTGGVVPMAVTLASHDMFQSFLGPQKQDALLHGHSYTAQPVGCAVANKALELLEKNDAKGADWQAAKVAWSDSPNMSASGFFSLWDREFIDSVSRMAGVDSVMSMGTVLKISLVDKDNSGYQSMASADFLKALRYPEGDTLAIHARPLGNTVYWMCSVNTPRKILRQVEDAISAALQAR